MIAVSILPPATALRVPNGGKLSRREIDLYTEFVGRYGAKGLAYIKVNDAAAGREGLQAPIVKFLPDEVLAKIKAAGFADAYILKRG